MHNLDLKGFEVTICEVFALNVYTLFFFIYV